MLKYIGGKKLIAKSLAMVMSEYEKKYNIESGLDRDYMRTYFEPCCGMASVASHMPHTNIILNDINPNVICLIDGVLNNFYSSPFSQLTKSQYISLKHQAYPSCDKSFYGFSSFRASWFGGSGDYKNGRRSTISTNIDNIKKFKEKMVGKNITLHNQSYDELTFEPENMLIYCDPPYKYSLGRMKGFLNSFEHDRFWDIIRRWSAKNLVFISETKAPVDFKVLWEKNTVSSLTHKTKVERLYIHKPC